MKAATASTDLVRTYLKEIGRVPLLTHEEEIVLGKQVKQMMVLLGLQAELTETLGREPSQAEWAAAAKMPETGATALGRRGW